MVRHVTAFKMQVKAVRWKCTRDNANIVIQVIWLYYLQFGVQNKFLLQGQQSKVNNVCCVHTSQQKLSHQGAGCLE